MQVEEQLAVLERHCGVFGAHEYPTTRRGNVVDTLHGSDVPDPYVVPRSVQRALLSLFLSLSLRLSLSLLFSLSFSLSLLLPLSSPPLSLSQ